MLSSQSLGDRQSDELQKDDKKNALNKSSMLVLSSSREDEDERSISLHTGGRDAVDPKNLI